MKPHPLTLYANKIEKPPTIISIPAILLTNIMYFLQAQVLYFDYGNRENVPFSRIVDCQRISSILCEIPQQVSKLIM